LALFLASISSTTTTTTMISQRPQRIRKPKVIWEAADDSRDHSASKTAPKALRTAKQRALTPTPVESLPIVPASLLPTLHSLNFGKSKASYYLPTSHRSTPFRNSSIFRLFSLWWKIQILARRVTARTALFHRRAVGNLQPMAKYSDILECGSI
jgi:hypothetical protein